MPDKVDQVCRLCKGTKLVPSGETVKIEQGRKHKPDCVSLKMIPCPECSAFDPPDQVHQAQNEKEGIPREEHPGFNEYGELNICLQCEHYEIGLRRLMRLSYSGYTMDTTTVRKEIRKILRIKP